MMLTYEEEQAIRGDFERSYASHAINWTGMDDTIEAVSERIKKDRDGRRYKNDATCNAWIGYQLAPVLSHMSTPDFLARLSRNQLGRCIELANERLEALRAVEKIKVWQVIVDDTTRFTAKTPAEAMDWLARFAVAFAAAPNKELLDLSRKAVSVESTRFYADELDDWLKGNEAPEDYERW